ncbi:hypothetical protein [Marinobacter sp. CHS3-4]|uniref:hypothetical protein n=1 Tax=Marinobacter sp. CHS3-4 TaxID=3045174 RepID=UPI0024B48CBF|nr:hypothetical protein [Marinobacter sp. CHS3-4]MDI9245958.1 hypothetical protein [Marinobacter sp. CHS3-4]
MTIYKQTNVLAATLLLASYSGVAVSAEGVDMDDKAKTVEHSSDVFRSGPVYPEQNYSYEAQLKIYGDKSENENPRALLELGNPIYGVGMINESSYWLGKKNPVNHEFAIYGDWRTAAAYNDNDVESEQRLATTLNLELDWRLTGTERIHAKLTPLEERNRFTRIVRNDDDETKDEEEFESDFRFDSLFFEGDLGYLVTGATGEYQSWDLPFAFGLMPLFFQNGIWVDDAFTGLAVTIPAQNSKALNISNYDVTFFAGFDDVNALNGVVDKDDTAVFGTTAFLEANQGYWEIGYGFVDDQSNQDVHDYHNVTVAFTKRYFGWLSNSIRVIGNFGQDEEANDSATGAVLLLENSLITELPSTLVPYFNFFVGVDNPQSLARGAGAGGILKNTGIVFEGDALTGFQSLNANANDVYGGAIGVSYLFDLSQQLVVEVGASIRQDSDATDTINQGNQYGVGVRYQRNLSRAWLARFDVTGATLENDQDSTQDRNIVSAKIELKRKF